MAPGIHLLLMSHELFPTKTSNVFFLYLCMVIPQLMETSDPVRKLAREAAGLGSSLEKVNVLLEQKSPTVKEAQNVLKVSYCK